MAIERIFHCVFSISYIIFYFPSDICGEDWCEVSIYDQYDHMMRHNTTGSFTSGAREYIVPVAHSI